MNKLVDRLRGDYEAQVRAGKPASEAWAEAKEKVSLDRTHTMRSDASQEKNATQMVYGLYDEGTGELFAVQDVGQLKAEFGSDQKMIAKVDRLTEGKTFTWALHGGEHEHPEAVIKAFGSREQVTATIATESTKRFEEAKWEASKKIQADTLVSKTTDAQQNLRADQALVKAGITSTTYRNDKGIFRTYVQGADAQRANAVILQAEARYQASQKQQEQAKAGMGMGIGL